MNEKKKILGTECRKTTVGRHGERNFQVKSKDLPSCTTVIRKELCRVVVDSVTNYGVLDK